MDALTRELLGLPHPESVRYTLERYPHLFQTVGIGDFIGAGVLFDSDDRLSNYRRAWAMCILEEILRRERDECDDTETDIR
jgi:hypothetical protein